MNKNWFLYLNRTGIRIYCGGFQKFIKHIIANFYNTYFCLLQKEKRNSVMSCVTMDGSVIPVVQTLIPSAATLHMTTLGTAATTTILYVVRIKSVAPPQLKHAIPTIRQKYWLPWQQPPAKKRHIKRCRITFSLFKNHLDFLYCNIEINYFFCRCYILFYEPINKLRKNSSPIAWIIWLNLILSKPIEATSPLRKFIQLQKRNPVCIRDSKLKLVMVVWF